MATNACRKFSVFDGMILIAATAVGIALARDWYEPSMKMAEVRGPIIGVYVASVWLMAAWSLALLYLRLRQPRPSLRRIGSQPGTIASVAAALALVLTFAEWLQHFVFWPPRMSDLWLWMNEEFRGRTPWLCGQGPCAVAAAWATLALVRRWRPEKGWLDRLGIILGICWLARPTLGWVAWYMPGLLSH